MEELYREGRIRAIGVSNFYPDRLVDLIAHNEVVPAINQVEMHPFCQQIESARVMEENDVRIQSWGPFAEGKHGMFQNEILSSIGVQYGKTVAQVILRWLLQRGAVAIPKSVHKKRIAENFDVFDFELERADMEKIAAMDTGESSFFSHRDPEIVKWLGNVKFDA